MPTNMSEAILFASQDEEEAEAVRLASQLRPRLRSTPKRASSKGLTPLASAIHKRNKGGC